MKWGLDAAVGPTEIEAHVWRDAGWQWFGGYIGGMSLHVWTPLEWQRVRKAEFDVLPIWVAPLTEDDGRARGVDEGNQCLERLQAIGLAGMVCLDVENGLTPEGYAAGFADAVNAGDCDVTLYGAPRTLLGLEGLGFSNWWLADWMPPGGQIAIPAPPDWSIWQWGTGSRCDYSVARDDFPFATFTW